MTSAENSFSGLRRRTRLGPSYRLDPTLGPAVLAAVELLHAGVLSRFASDAVVEALIARGHMSGTILPMPRSDSIKTPSAASAAIDDVLRLCSSMDDAMVQQPGVSWALRAATLEQFDLVTKTFPHQPPFAWPAARAHNRELPGARSPLRLHAPESYLDALPRWIAAQRKVSTKSGIGQCVLQAMNAKFDHLGLDPIPFLREPSLVVRKLELKTLPSLEGTGIGRSMEERFLAVIQALEEIAAARIDVDLSAFRAITDRLLAVATTVSREE
ncbi:MAG: hypothetical protein Q8O67_11130 [Deltaproteobacteria bacterium]|nr:hypothetical protein [Deltaproteobacteria bacterium]